MTDIEIARNAKGEPIQKIGEKLDAINTSVMRLVVLEEEAQRDAGNR